MRLELALANWTKSLTDLEFETPRLDVDLIVAFVLGVRRTDLYLSSQEELSLSDWQRANDLILRRQRGEPIAYILGEKAFYKLDFYVGPEVLIPRPDSEALVERALCHAENLKDITELRILDAGLGSGCLGLSVLRELLERGYSRPKLFGFDLSAEAVRCSYKNALRHNLDAQVHFVEADIREYLKNLSSKHLNQSSERELTYDLILTNPPYVGQCESIAKEVRDFEPALALFGGMQGWEIPSQWLNLLSPFVSQRGGLFMEIGATHAEVMMKQFRDTAKFDFISITHDLAGRPRVVSGVCHSGSK